MESDCDRSPAHTPHRTAPHASRLTREGVAERIHMREAGDPPFSAIWRPGCTPAAQWELGGGGQLPDSGSSSEAGASFSRAFGQWMGTSLPNGRVWPMRSNRQCGRDLHCLLFCPPWLLGSRLGGDSAVLAMPGRLGGGWHHPGPIGAFLQASSAALGIGKDGGVLGLLLCFVMQYGRDLNCFCVASACRDVGGGPPLGCQLGRDFRCRLRDVRPPLAT